jgi:hypothetical protein
MRFAALHVSRPVALKCLFIGHNNKLQRECAKQGAEHAQAD